MDVIDEQLCERRPKDDAIDPAINHAVDLSQFIAGTGAAVAPARQGARMNGPQSNWDMVRSRQGVVNPGEHLGPVEVEWWHHYADHSCLSRLNALHQEIRSIFETLGCLQNPLTRLVGVPSTPG